MFFLSQLNNTYLNIEAASPSQIPEITSLWMSTKGESNTRLQLNPIIIALFLHAGTEAQDLWMLPILF